ncbi:hypothetical protein I7I50_10026 [Histoplasma capsulatum G186AR]|uniref:Transmembrane protein n=1 Tax=Ajellomyces capsulatus TaxID=5037 RepID=A0A8H8D757_AJECA|nr:hypothetical protein I7I52_01264 [Histoplasma capsulatum]QSS68900.1 hypothetical protein I7I50_10026 [Histoplasma capsulatum G186AR]
MRRALGTNQFFKALRVKRTKSNYLFFFWFTLSFLPYLSFPVPVVLQAAKPIAMAWCRSSVGSDWLPSNSLSHTMQRYRHLLFTFPFLSLLFFFSDGDGSGAVLWRPLGAWWGNAALALGGTLALFHSFSFFKTQVRAAQIPFSLDGGDIIYIVGFYCERTERGMEQNVLTDG